MESQSAGSGTGHIIATFPSLRLLVIGDIMLDEFIWGKVSRISPEAPVPIVNVTGESYYPGGGANVARNLREFTGSVAVMGRAGTDAHGDRLLGLLGNAGIDTSCIQRDAISPTAVKTRVIARNQQVVRVDRETRTPLTAAQTERAMQDLDGMIGGLDAIIVADYGKGFLTQTLADHICETARKSGAVLAIDPHPHTSLSWRSATVIKPNRAEAFIAAGLPGSDPVVPVLEDHALIEACTRLRARWETRSLLVTLGEHGILLFHGDSEPYHRPTVARDVYDVSGAGDTAIAVLTLALAGGGSPREAAELANRASGIVVGKLGTATVTAAELVANLQADLLAKPERE